MTVYCCNHCGHLFDEDEIGYVQTWGGDRETPSEYENVCPECGSDSFEEAVCCEICEEYFPEEDMYPSDIYDGYLCHSCNDAVNKIYPLVAEAPKAVRERLEFDLRDLREGDWEDLKASFSLK